VSAIISETLPPPSTSSSIPNQHHLTSGFQNKIISAVLHFDWYGFLPPVRDTFECPAISPSINICLLLI
jgi:hypothetical protein